MPISTCRDDFDVHCPADYLTGEVERLAAEVKILTESIAHDLRTPLTRARARLHRICQAAGNEADEIVRVIAELDEVLERLGTLLRISEIEARERQAGFSRVNLSAFIEQVVDLYQPLAEAGRIRLMKGDGHSAEIAADPKLLFEAVSRLVENAIKFTGAGGVVKIEIGDDHGRPRIIVEDNGPGIPADQRATAPKRFHRTEGNQSTGDAGLGLSVVSAIVRLHRFQFALQDASPGVRAVIECWVPREFCTQRKRGLQPRRCKGGTPTDRP